MDKYLCLYCISKKIDYNISKKNRVQHCGKRVAEETKAQGMFVVELHSGVERVRDR
jgi:hypothetical protein